MGGIGEFENLRSYEGEAAFSVEVRREQRDLAHAKIFEGGSSDLLSGREISDECTHISV
jgi:hypothetical protein